MNHRRSSWTVLPLLVSLATVVALIGPWGCGGGGSSTVTPVKKDANVAVAFIASPVTVPPGVPGFRHVLLNISAVRLNPSATAGLNDTKWVTIPVPSAAGNSAGGGPGDLQIDLNHLQTGATLFNTAPVPVGTYQQVQVVVDPSLPGTIIPACQATNVNQEGCTNYPLAFTNATTAVTYALTSPISASKGTLAVLLIKLSLTIDTPPESTGGAYGITVKADAAGEPDPNSYLGLVTGTVSGSGSSSSSLSVSAEPAGTGNVVASVPLTNGNFSLELPAAPDTGTLYDLFVSGQGSTFDAQQGIHVFAGTQNSPLDFNVKAVGATSVGGKISDTCTGAGIAGAIVQILAPPSNVSTSVDCTQDPQQCVVVGTTSTDETGFYPLLLTRALPSVFTRVPASQAGLALKAAASGYNSLSTPLHSTSGTGLCPDSTASGGCSFSLLTGTITGTVNLLQAPLSGQSVQVEVLAEDSGTNNLVSALIPPLVFHAGQTSQNFVLNVPVAADSNSPAPVFDLFAAAIDPYLGATDPYPGHTIEVAPAVTGPGSKCESTAVLSSDWSGPLDCTGHGSISGTVSNPDANTIVEVIKDGVQLLGTSPGLFSSATGSSNTNYSLCVPPNVLPSGTLGTYTVQRFEESASGVESSPGASTTVTVPVPTATSSPCPSSCSLTSASCPGQCFATVANPL